jgi:4-diphosphocytidyl-2-C-methyl-D-erythritol kinase
VYRRFDELDQGARGEADSEKRLEALLAGMRGHSFSDIYPNLCNDLESATMARDEVEELKEVALKAGARAALMSGSGPTVFALVSGIEEAAEVAWELEKIAPITIVTSFSDRGADLKE